MTELLTMQKEEANIGFAKYITKNYLEWVNPKNIGKTIEGKPVMSPDIFKTKIFQNWIRVKRYSS